MNTARFRRLMCVILVGLNVSLLGNVQAVEPPLVMVDQFGDPLPPLAVARIGSSRYWHGAREVGLLAFSRDGKLLASAADVNGSIRPSAPRFGDRENSGPEYKVCLWEPASGKLVRKLAVAEIPGAIAFGPNHQVAAGQEKDICLWDADTGQVIRRWPAHEKRVSRLMFSSDGRYLASGSLDGRIHLWNPETGEKLRLLADHAGAVTSLSFSNDCKLIATAGSDGAVQTFNVETGKRLHFEFVRRPACVVFHPRENVLAFLTTDRTEPNSRRLAISICDATTGEQKRLVSTSIGGGYDTEDLAFSSDGERLVLKEKFGTVDVIEAATGRSLLRLRVGGHEGGFAIAPDGNYLAVGDDAWVNVFDLQTGRSLLAPSGARAGRHRPPIFSPDGHLLAVPNSEGVVLWDLVRQQSLSVLPGSASRWPRPSLGFSFDGRLLYGATGNFGEEIVFWEVATGQEVRKLDARRMEDPLQLNERNTQLITIDRRGNVSILDALSGKPIKTWRLPGRWPKALLSPTAKRVVVTDARDKDLKVFDVESEKELWAIPSGRFSPDKPVFTNQGQHLAWLTAEVLELRDVETGKIVQRVKLPKNVQLHDVSDDEKFACGQDAAGRTRLWELARGREVLPPIETAVASILSADGRWFVTTAADRSLLVWDIAQAIARIESMEAVIDPVPLDPEVSPLIAAANTGDLNALRKALDDGAKIADVDPKWGSPLHLAAMQGSVPIVRELLARGADPKSLGPQGMTPLVLAIKHGRAAVVTLLLEAGALPNQADGRSLLIAAAGAGQTEVWKQLLDRGIPLPNDLGQPPLSNEDLADLVQIGKRLELLAEANREIVSAVSAGEIERVRSFLALQPSLILQRFSDRTLLGWAVSERQPGVAGELLELGADVEARLGDGTALHLATRFGDRGMVEQLLSAGAQLNHDRPTMPASVLEVAARYGHVELVKLFLEKGVDPNGPPRVAGGSLHIAVREDQLAVAQILLAHKADPNLTSYWDPALHIAAQKGSTEMIVLLLKHGADPKLLGAYGRTAMQVAAFHDQRSVVQHFARLGLPVDIHSAAAIGDTKRVEELLAINPRVVDERLVDGRTPLHVAAASEQLSTTALLLELGADPNARDLQFQTPLDKVHGELPNEPGAGHLVAEKGGKKTSGEERLKLQIDAKNAPAPLYGAPLRTSGIYLYPGGRRITANDEVTMLVENIAGRRVRSVEIERDGIRLNVVDDPNARLSLTVTTWRAGEQRVERYDTWDAVARTAPDVFHAYELHRAKIDAENLDGRNIYVGGFGRLGFHPSTPMVGVSGKPHASGFLLDQVLGPAEQAGLKVGDVLTHIDGVAVTNFEELQNLVGKHEIGQEARVGFLRDNQPHIQAVTLGARPEGGGEIILIDGGTMSLGGSISHR